ncbi:MAG TPA: nucleotidyltransferase domain-containing protein [bacterium]|nr:nucleotidyltransferase domain-containing protein [bacterium]
MQVDVATEEVLVDIAETLGRAGPVIRVILYGSRAAGTAGTESDIDLVIVEAGAPDKRREQRRLRALLPPDLPVWVDLWVMGEEQFQEEKDVIGGLAYPANKYGRVLYEKP